MDEIGSLDDTIRSLTITEDDDPDEDEIASVVETVVITPELQASLATGVSRERFAAGLSKTPAVEPPAPAPAPRADPISAPGGQPGSAGISTAPNAGAEKQPTGKKPMRQQLMTAFVGENMGVFVDALNKTTSDDPELLAGIIARTSKAQIAAGVAEHPVVALAARNDINTVGDLTAALDRAKDGDTYLSDVRADAKKEAIRAFGADNGPMVASSVDHQSLAAAKISRDAWRASADKTFGIGEDGSAPPRKTAPNGAVAVYATATAEKPEGLWSRMDKSTQDQANAGGRLDTDAKKEEYAQKLYNNLKSSPGGDVSSVFKGVD